MIIDKYYKISKKYPLEIKSKQKFPKFVHRGFWYRNLFGQWVLSFSNIVHNHHHLLQALILPNLVLINLKGTLTKAIKS